MSSIGHMDAYRCGDDLDDYVERLEQYFIANEIGSLAVGVDDTAEARETAQRKKVATFLTLVGPEAYRLLKSLLSPAIPASKTFPELIEVLGKHLKPKKLIVAERFRFHQRNQSEGETVAQFEAALRKLASTCEFELFLNQALRDQFVCGVRSESTQKKLLCAEITFEQSVHTALADEIADSEARAIHGREPDYVRQSSVHAVSDKGHSRGQFNHGYGKHTAQKSQGKHQHQQKCFRCNGDHLGHECRFRDAVCHACGRTGHIQKACRKKGAMSTNVVNAKCTAEVKQTAEYSLYSLSTQQNAVTVQIEVDGKSIDMLVDTGSGVTVIGERTFYDVWKHKLPLLTTASDVTLKSYTGQSITVLGKFEPSIKYNGQTVVMPILIVKGDRPNLLGRDILGTITLDWANLFHVQHATSSTKLEEEFPDVFSDGLGTLKREKVRLYVDKSAVPRFHKARPVPYIMKEKIEDELQRLQDDGIIEPVTFSKWAAPIVPVRKGTGVRICGDYKVTVNQAIVEDKYPLPKVDDLYTSLAGGKTFTKLDLSRAYLQLILDEESHEYVTINTHKGLFRYTRLPFGVSVAPSVFQRTLESLLAGIPNVCIFLDDILVTGKTEAEHMENLRLVLQRLQNAGLKVNKQKCEFFRSSVTYLGHRIDRHGLHPTTEKVEAIRNAPNPTNVKELKAWLCLVNYYGRYMENLSSKRAPLYMLLKKGVKWMWSKTQEDAFIEGKEALQSDALLVHFDPNKPLVLACAASPYGCGAVLSHQMPDGTERPIAYASRSLSVAEKNYSQLDREALSLIFGVKKFHQYLYGAHFTLLTDQRPLLGLLGENRPIPPNASGRIQRWALVLAGYNYTIRHRSGSTHENCDALSRLPLPTKPDVTPSPADILIDSTFALQS